MRIGVDIDGVLRDFIGALTAQYKKDFPDHKVNPITRWDLHPFFPIGEGIYDYVFNTRPKEIFEFGNPYPRALSAMLALTGRGHEIIYITAQSRGREVYTLKWLLTHDFPYSGLFFTEAWKGAIDCDIFIEDNPNNIKTLQAANKRVFCYRQSYNKTVDCPSVSTLEEFVGMVDWINNGHEQSKDGENAQKAPRLDCASS